MRLFAAFTSLLIGSAAAAQLPPPETRGPPLVDGRVAGPGTWRDLGDVRERIGRGRDAGTITRREARALRREAGQVGVLADRYEAGGVSLAEQRELDTRTRVLREQVDLQRLRGAGAKR